MKQAYLYAISAVLFWSTVATAFKIALMHLTPLMLLYIAACTSLLFYAGLVTYRRQWPQYKSWQGKDWLFSLLLGTLNPAVYYIILFNAYDRLPAQEASTLNYSWPIMLVLLSSLFHKRWPGWVTFAALLVCFCGSWVIASHGKIFSMQFSDGFGVFLALFSTIIWAGFWLLNNEDTQPAVLRLLVNFAVAVVLLTIFMLLTDSFHALTIKGLAGGIYVGLFEMGITFVLWRNALKAAGEHTAKVSILIYIIPFISLWIIHFVLHEPILPSTFIGLIFIIAGILWEKSQKIPGKS